jgi:hypothetical protein
MCVLLWGKGRRCKTMKREKGSMSTSEKALPFRYQFAAGAVAGISEVRNSRFDLGLLN